MALRNCVPSSSFDQKALVQLCILQHGLLQQRMLCNLCCLPTQASTRTHTYTENGSTDKQKDTSTHTSTKILPPAPR
jgi:hypothetical protein